MRILINGLALFGKRLAADLKEFDPASQFIFCDTYGSRTEQLKFLTLLPFADAVISMNGVTDRSGSLDAVHRLGKKLILQWQGTDALNALKRKKEGTLLRRYIDRAVNWVDSPWLFDEITCLDVRPEYSYFKHCSINQPVGHYDELRVMSYVAQQRQEFYGIVRVIRIAEMHPEIPFDIYGSSSTPLMLPSNVHLRGWVDGLEFQRQLSRTPVFLRLTEHEGFPVSVIEAMSWGCEVLMSMPYDMVVYSRTAEEDEDNFQLLVDRLQSRGMTPNLASVAWARNEFDKNRVIKTYWEKLNTIVSSKGTNRFNG